MKKSDITPVERPNYIIPGPAQVERYIPQDVLNKVKYKGERITSQGATVTSFLAQRALSQLFTGEPLPIFEDFPGVPTELGYNNLATKYKGEEQGLIISDTDPNTWFLVMATEGARYPTVRQNIREAAESSDITDRPIVMLVTSGMPHAILYIFHEAKLYTCGYGYSSEISHNYKNLTSDLLTKAGKTDIAHTFEKMTGAIFTADAMSPSENHQAKISWIGFLDKGMVDRIQDFFNNTLLILFSGKKEGRYNKVSNKAKLVVSNSYYAAAGILPSREAYNCLTWAQNILGVNINCGLLGSPSDCKGITEEQFALFKASMNYSDLPKVIADIQQTLIAPRGICSKVGEALGLCSSSKKGGKKKSKGKSRKGKGKDRRRKGKSRRKNN
jgi:hypothetical protein